MATRKMLLRFDKCGVIKNLIRQYNARWLSGSQIQSFKIPRMMNCRLQASTVMKFKYNNLKIHLEVSEIVLNNAVVGHGRRILVKYIVFSRS